MIALIAGKENVTFAGLAARVGEEAARLAGLPAGVETLDADSTIGFVARVLACLEARRTAAIFSPGWSPAEREARAALLRSPLHPEAALILFTSGSTGAPKAVQLSRACIEANTRAVLSSLDFHHAPAQTLFLPLSYSFGLLGQLLPALEARIPTRLIGRLTDLKELFDNGQAAGMLSGVPSHWETILRLTSGEPPCRENVTHVISAGAPMPPELRARLKSRFPAATLYNNYGQTEASPRLLSFSSRHPDFFTGPVGFPVEGVEVKLGDEGELLARGPQLMLGYLGDEAGTREKLAGGWLHTGDLATIGEGGLVTILGRKDELFNVGGERTSPFEIDQALARAPGVAQGAVLIEPDTLYGARLTGFVVAAEPGRPPAKSELMAALGAALSTHKIPRELYLADELPRSANGKLRRGELKNLKAPARRLK